jgi:hypothetical protein
MASTALTRWQTIRRARISTLFGVHGLALVRASAAAEYLIRELILRLAAEFHGFARDLHDVAAAEHVSRITAQTPGRAVVLSDLFLGDRWLDRGNLTAAALGADFGRFGLDVWGELSRRDARAAAWRTDLTYLHAARGAIAGAARPTARAPSYPAWPPTLAVGRRWQAVLDGLAAVLDEAVADQILDVYGKPRPW